MKIASMNSVRLLALVVFLSVVPAQRASHAAEPFFRRAYSCAPDRAWDAGYKVAIVQDKGTKQYFAWVYQVTIAGEKFAFAEKVDVFVARTGPASCIIDFRQSTPNANHDFELIDKERDLFELDMSVEGERVDGPFSHLKCDVATWFMMEHPACGAGGLFRGPILR